MSGKDDPEIAVLFVCLGNICRSPMAEGAFTEAARKAGLEVRADSAGTAGYHIGERPDRRAIATAQRHGVSISHLRGRKIETEDFIEFSHIFALDSANLAGIKAQDPGYGKARLALLLDAVPGKEGEAVADPYYGDEDGFETCWQDIEEATGKIVEKLLSEGADARFR